MQWPTPLGRSDPTFIWTKVKSQVIYTQNQESLSTLPPSTFLCFLLLFIFIFPPRGARCVKPNRETVVIYKVFRSPLRFKHIHTHIHLFTVYFFVFAFSENEVKFLAYLKKYTRKTFYSKWPCLWRTHVQELKIPSRLWVICEEKQGRSKEIQTFLGSVSRLKTELLNYKFGTRHFKLKSILQKSSNRSKKHTNQLIKYV